MGRKCGAVTPLGNKMLFVPIVKIMTHQMEHFKEIHTRLSAHFLSHSLSSLLPSHSSLFPAVLSFASHEEYHIAPKSTKYLSLLSLCTQRIVPPYTDIQVSGTHLQILSVNLDLFTSYLFLCVLAFQCL